jgi:hypothetical protein
LALEFCPASNTTVIDAAAVAASPGGGSGWGAVRWVYRAARWSMRVENWVTSGRSPG